MKKIRNLALLMIVSLSILLIGSNKVYANDYSTSTGGSGNSGAYNNCGYNRGITYPILWVTTNASEGDTIKGWGKENGKLREQYKTLYNGESRKRITQVSYLSTNTVNKDIVWTSTGNCKGVTPYNKVGIKNGWVRWSYLASMRKDAADGWTINKMTTNLAIKNSFTLSDKMVQNIEGENGALVEKGYENMLYYKKDNRVCANNKYSVDCEWFDLITDGKELWQPNSRITTKTVIVKEDCKDKACTTIDRTPWSDDKLWREAPTTATYVYESKEGEYEYHHNLTYTLVTVIYHETWKEDPNGNIKDKKTWYTRGSEITDSKPADWSAKKPVLETKYYKPYDLYTEKQIDDANKVFSGDRLKYLVNDQLKLHLDNHINQDNSVPVNERYLDTLDDNGSLSWTLTFNNDQFGIPRASEGGLDIYKDHKNVNEIGIGKTQYYNPIFYINSSISNNNITSLSFGKDGKEAVGNNEIKQYYGNRGGDYFFRGIKTGNYNISSSKWSGFWSVEYQSGQYYKYGSRYEGTVKIVDNKLVWSPLENNKIKVVETNKYTGEQTGSFVQPILRGGIRIKTVGGYKPN